MFETLQYIKRNSVIYILINRREKRGHCWLVAPLILRSRGAVHQSVNTLPSGWPSTSPLFGISHWTTFGPPPPTMWPVSSVRVLLSSARSLAFDHVSLLWPEQRALIRLLSRLHIRSSSTPHSNPDVLCFPLLIQPGWRFNGVPSPTLLLLLHLLMPSLSN